MTLTTHGITGALISGVLINYPVVGLPLAFASHFLLDAIPHMDYKILSLDEDEANNGVVVMNKGKNFLIDLTRIGSDGALGLIAVLFLSYLASPESYSLFLVGAILGMLPDALQFIYGKYRFSLLTPVQNFHSYIHTDIRFKHNFFWGVSSQLGLIALIIILWLWYF